jgi:glycosyltransferase involved in cell wall biosynthesis
MKEKVYKFVTYAKKRGLKGAVAKSAKYFLKKTQAAVPRPLDIMVDIADVKAADFITNPYTKPAKIKKSTLKIGWILSPISAGSGGQNTITRFARYLKSQGHDVTIYLYEAIQPQSVQEAKNILSSSFKFDVNVKKISDYSESDVVFATGWETAYPLFNLETNAHKMYFVQDFEPYFYGVGTKSILAENTYKMGFYGITAGKWLANRMSTQYGMPASYFNFGADLDIYKPDEAVEKKKKIIFYARPVTERRAFELGVIALDIFHTKHPEYEIEFIGWDTSGYQVPFPYVNRGILSHEELADLYQESVACLVLSLTNVSLLPLELLAAGCVPVVNAGDNNSMVLGENENIRYAEATPIQLAEELSRAVAASDLQKQAQLAVNSVRNLSWDASYRQFEKILLEEVTK